MRSDLNEPGTRNFALVATWQNSRLTISSPNFLFIRWSIDPTADGSPYNRPLEGLKNWEDTGIKTLVAVIKSQHYCFFSGSGFPPRCFTNLSNTDRLITVLAQPQIVHAVLMFALT